MKDKILKKISEQCESIKMCFNERGYVNSNEGNLLDTITNWNEIKKELELGQGNELKSDKSGLAKFNAIHSSSALAVNNFAELKRNQKNCSFLNFCNFNEVNFEKKLPTGISTPNLDIYFETNNATIGVESKYTEYLSPKLPNDSDNLVKYLNNKKLNYLPNEFHSDLIQHYVSCKNKLYLDVAQLIKHSIGIINKSRSRFKFILNSLISQPVLVYIYWQPENWYNFELFRKHNDEILEFSKLIKPFLTFISISYLDFWKTYENNRCIGKTIHKAKERYNIIL